MRVCTAVIEVPRDGTAGVRLLAVRDEDPGRAWDAPGHWWPELVDVVGVRDRLAGGAWLAASSATGRIALILNRAEASARAIPEAANPLASRGALVLDSVMGEDVPTQPRTANFNLVSIEGTRAIVTTWDGQELRKVELEPGMHMIAHHEVNDADNTPRIARWLPKFEALAGLPGDTWRGEWIALLEESTSLSADDDRAIIRDNRAHGYPTLSLLYCMTESIAHEGSASQLEVSHTPDSRRIQIDAAVFSEPGHWHHTRVESLLA